MRIVKNIIFVSLLLTFLNPLFAGGQKDLTEKPEGMGLLVVGNDGKFGEPFRWVYKMTFLNSTDKQDYIIEIPSLNDPVKFTYLPPGNYSIKKIIQRHYDGSAYIPDSEIPLHVYSRLNLRFSINDGTITIFPYFIYKFNNKRNVSQNLEIDGNNYDLPPDFIKFYGTTGHIYLWDHSDISLQYLFYLTISDTIEEKILKSLLLIEGADQWLYKPMYNENIAFWPNIPVSEEEIEVIVEIPPWELPEIPPYGDLYILSIGIDVYKDEELLLSGAGSSALDFSDFIATREKGNYREIYVNTLADNFISKNQILEEINKITDLANPEDTTILYISSHGISDIKGRPFILPSDGAVSNITSTCLPYRTLYKELEKNRGLVLSILDVGRSGSWINGREAFFSFNSSNLSQVLKRSEIPIGMYSVSSGVFLKGDQFRFPKLLKGTVGKNNNGSISSESFWNSFILVDNPNGLWSSTSKYNEVVEERAQLAKSRHSLLMEIELLVNEGNRIGAFSLIDTKEVEQYLSPESLTTVKDSMKNYFDNTKQ